MLGCSCGVVAEMYTGSIVLSHNPVTAWETFQETLHIGDWSRLRSVKRDMGGYYSASWQMPLRNRPWATGWLFNGLGRDVGLFTLDGRSYWEGFVNEIILDTGTIKIAMSLREVANKVWGRRIPVGGGNVARSTVANHAASQGRFGVKEEVLNCGEMSAAPAEDLAQKYLNLHYWPKLSRFSWSQGKPGLTFRCLGYWHTLNWRIYTQTILAGEANASTVVAAVIAEMGDFVASSTIETNTTQIAQKLDSDRRGGDIVESVAEAGDSAYHRFIVGIEAVRHFYYRETARPAL